MSCCMDDICFHKLLQHLKLFHQKMYCGELRTDWEIPRISWRLSSWYYTVLELEVSLKLIWSTEPFNHGAALPPVLHLKLSPERPGVVCQISQSTSWSHCWSLSLELLNSLIRDCFYNRDLGIHRYVSQIYNYKFIDLKYVYFINHFLLKLIIVMYTQEDKHSKKWIMKERSKRY